MELLKKEKDLTKVLSAVAVVVLPEEPGVH